MGEHIKNIPDIIDRNTSQKSIETSLESIKKGIVCRLEKLITDEYGCLYKNCNSSEETAIENDKLILRYAIPLDGGINLLLGCKNDEHTYVLLQDERIPHYAPVEHEYRCSHHIESQISGDSFDTDWIPGIDDLFKKLRGY